MILAAATEEVEEVVLEVARDKTTRFGEKRLPRYQIFLYRLAGTILAIAIWDLVVRAELVNRLFLPSPLQTWHAFTTLVGNGGLLTQVWATFQEAIYGFLLGSAVGIVLGVTLGVLPRLNEVVSPFVTVMNAMPRIAMAPLFILWFGIGTESHVALVFSLVVFIVMTNAIAGAQAVDREHLVLARLLGAKRPTILQKIVLPSVVPWIMAAMRLAWAYALAGAVVGEMFLGQNGLGYLIQASSGVLNIAAVFAVLGVTVALAWLVDSLLRLAERWILRWRPQATI